MELFGDRVAARTEALGSVVVVGLDPRPELLRPEQERAAGASLRALARAYRTFCEDLLDAVDGIALAVKLQIAFFESLGLPGIRTYAQIVRSARRRGVLVIGDIKRGDIGTSSEAYAAAHFGGPSTLAGSDVDAVTLSPYLGVDAIQPFLPFCRERGKGLFVLVRTSNPSAVQLQDLKVDGLPLYARVAELVDSWGADLVGRSGYASVGAVVGATYPGELWEIRGRHPRMPILVPGYGAQGGTAADVAPALDARGAGLLVSSSRGIMKAYRDASNHGEDSIVAVRRAAARMRDEIRAAMHSDRSARTGRVEPDART